MRLCPRCDTNKIGASCFEVHSGGTRIVLEIGMPLVKPGGKEGGKFDLREYRGLSGPELIKQKILPDVPGLYRWDTEAALADALLLSHAHLDHYGFYHYVHRDVRFYLGEATRELIEFTAGAPKEACVIENYLPIRSGQTFSCGTFCITPFLMDHSAFDAYAFVIEANGRRLIYSGDFRGHGRKFRALDYFLSHAPASPDVLLLEGTNVSRSHQSAQTEEELEKAVVRILKETDGIVLLYLSSQNVDRLVSFFKAVRKARRLFVVDVYTATVLDIMAKHAKIPFPDKRYPELRVCFPQRICQWMKRRGASGFVERFGPHNFNRDKIAADPKLVVMTVRPSMLEHLRRMSGLEGGTFIYSMWDGYREEQPTRRLLQFVESKGMRVVDLHTSGHADAGTLQRVVTELKPKRLVPIHTFRSERYTEFGAPVTILRDGQWLEV